MYLWLDFYIGDLCFPRLSHLETHDIFMHLLGDVCFKHPVIVYCFTVCIYYCTFTTNKQSLARQWSHANTLPLTKVFLLDLTFILVQANLFHDGCKILTFLLYHHCHYIYQVIPVVRRSRPFQAIFVCFSFSDIIHIPYHSFIHSKYTIQCFSSFITVKYTHNIKFTTLTIFNCTAHTVRPSPWPIPITPSFVKLKLYTCETIAPHSPPPPAAGNHHHPLCL